MPLGPVLIHFFFFLGLLVAFISGVHFGDTEGREKGSRAGINQLGLGALEKSDRHVLAKSQA